MQIPEEVMASSLKNMRERILMASAKSSEGHIPSAFSILEILYSIYIDKDGSPSTDDFEFILSKGHASLALYAILEEIQLIGADWIENFGSFESDFGGHPDMRKVPGVSASTGSLGHGLPIALGKILANRALNQRREIICLVGDGEMNEGTIWESLLLASHHKMEELSLFIDFNHSTDRALSLGDLTKKLDAFGFEVKNVEGHSVESLRLARSVAKVGLPRAVIAHTVKGFGIPEMENNPAWHHLSPNSEQLAQLRENLK